MRRIVEWMDYFWWRCACPLPEGRVSNWIYNWTKRLHLPWHALRHADERWRWPHMAGWRKAPRLAASLLLLPVGFGVWLYGGRCWPLQESAYALAPSIRPSQGKAEGA